jgi:DNA-binding transcriptional LysR family regulator
MTKRHTRIVERAMTRLKLRQLRLLVAVSKHGNIQNAARDLGVSQPAATKMIQDLELDFEVKLFDRTNRGVVPTIFGESLIRHCNLILAEISKAALELDDLNEGHSGRIVIGTLLAATPSLLPSAMKQLLKDHPNIAIKIVEGTNEVLMPSLLSGEIDMVVGRLPQHRHRVNITQEKLFDEHVEAVTGSQHPLANTRQVSFEHLMPFGWILPPVETTLRRQIDLFFIQQDQYIPEVAIESVSYLANRTLLRNHDFIGLMPSNVASYDVERGALSRIDWQVPFGAGPVGVSFRSTQSLSPIGLAFLNTLRETAVQFQTNSI